MAESLWEQCKAGDFEAVRAALEAGQDVNQQGGIHESTGLMLAVQAGNEALVRLLLQQV